MNFFTVVESDVVGSSFEIFGISMLTEFGQWLPMAYGNNYIYGNKLCNLYVPSNLDGVVKPFTDTGDGLTHFTTIVAIMTR